MAITENLHHFKFRIVFLFQNLVRENLHHFKFRIVFLFQNLVRENLHHFKIRIVFLFQNLVRERWKLIVTHKSVKKKKKKKKPNLRNVMRKLVFGVSDQVRQLVQLQRLARVLKVWI